MKVSMLFEKNVLLLREPTIFTKYDCDFKKSDDHWTPDLQWARNSMRKLLSSQGESILQNLLEMWPVKIRKKVASRAMRNIRLRSFASGQRGKEEEWERGSI